MPIDYNKATNLAYDILALQGELCELLGVSPVGCMRIDIEDTTVFVSDEYYCSGGDTLARWQMPDEGDENT